jgi:hypothetical protein
LSAGSDVTRVAANAAKSRIEEAKYIMRKRENGTSLRSYSCPGSSTPHYYIDSIVIKKISITAPLAQHGS